MKASPKKVVSVHFGTLDRAQPAELTARFSKCDFWNLGEILHRHRWKDFFVEIFSLKQKFGRKKVGKKSVEK